MESVRVEGGRGRVVAWRSTPLGHFSDVRDGKVQGALEPLGAGAFPRFMRGRESHRARDKDTPAGNISGMHVVVVGVGMRKWGRGRDTRLATDVRGVRALGCSLAVPEVRAAERTIMSCFGSRERVR